MYSDLHELISTVLSNRLTAQVVMEVLSQAIQLNVTFLIRCCQRYVVQYYDSVVEQQQGMIDGRDLLVYVLLLGGE